MIHSLKQKTKTEAVSKNSVEFIQLKMCFVHYFIALHQNRKL